MLVGRANRLIETNWKQRAGSGWVELRSVDFRLWREEREWRWWLCECDTPYFIVRILQLKRFCRAENDKGIDSLIIHSFMMKYP
jgi:hypothetical protein